MNQLVDAEVGRPKPIPFGQGRPLLGVAAVDTLYDLCEVPRWTEGNRRWAPSDKWSFHNWFNIEVKIPAAQAEMGTDIEDLNAVLLQFHGALPFDEVERDWLFDAYDKAYGENSIKTLRRQEATIVSGGLRRVIQGRDLMRRWWSWRRETDEFSGQGSLDLAREALRELVETYSPDMELPEPYLALRGINQPTPSAPTS